MIHIILIGFLNLSNNFNGFLHELEIKANAAQEKCTNFHGPPTEK